MNRLGAGVVFTLAVTTALVGATRPDAGPPGAAMPVLQTVEMPGDFLDVEMAPTAPSRCAF
ncbi:MAG: hypothetical protein AAFV19_15265 [Pseudomonadota bacterium]